MRALKAKRLRAIARASGAQALSPVTEQRHNPETGVDLAGTTRYPAGTYRRVYQDSKRGQR